MSDLGRISGGMATPLHQEFTVDAVPKFRDQTVKASTAARIGHAISGAFGSFGRKVANLGSRLVDVFHGKQSRVERDYNRAMVAYDRKLSGLVDGMARGKLGGEDALRGFQELQGIAQRMDRLSLEAGRPRVDHRAMVTNRTSAMMTRLQEKDPATAQQLRRTLGDGYNSDTVRVGMETSYTGAHATINRMAEMFGETPPPLDLASDRVLGQTVDDYHNVLMAVRQEPG